MSNDDLYRKLIQANHILHYRNVVDAYGHISVRNPDNNETFFMSRELPPALVARREDVEEYRISDASPTSTYTGSNYQERFIHSEMYKKYKGVQVVIHAHAEVVLPFTINSVPLRPVFFLGAAVGPQPPVYDPSEHFDDTDPHYNLLVNNVHLGACLANDFNPSSKATENVSEKPQYQTVLMRGHGFTCVGETIEEAVFRAVYTCANAQVQTTALLMQGSHNLQHLAPPQRLSGSGGMDASPPAKHEGIRYLTDRQIQDTKAMHSSSVQRPWKLWCAEVASVGLYQNEFLASS